MTACLGKSCSFGLLCVSFMNVYGTGDVIVLIFIITFLFPFHFSHFLGVLIPTYDDKWFANSDI